ncbi:hypothetical protein DEO72_LG2g3247 [Vigna unguiculata]|uniref:Uncharacterized protein n=1 Tax=Vigna unguiculata TaxID=3917 RepID=A0A4D6L369_VIGUN|nr:hypothetical protein DEO72_LG2g3247 [Vigna unguiculata]
MTRWITGVGLRIRRSVELDYERRGWKLAKTFLELWLRMTSLELWLGIEGKHMAFLELWLIMTSLELWLGMKGKLTTFLNLWLRMVSGTDVSVRVVARTDGLHLIMQSQVVVSDVLILC